MLKFENTGGNYTGERVRCSECHRVFSARVPRHGDGSLIVPARIVGTGCLCGTAL